MTTMASSTEAILEKLVRLAYGDFDLVLNALAETAREAEGVPSLEAVVQYILTHRRTAESAPNSGRPS